MFSKDLLTCSAQALTKTVVFVGEKRSGKSSLAAKFLETPLKDDMEVTTALDFQYGTKVREDKKVKVNVYELGGGRILANMLSSVLNGANVGSTAVCIVVDLSKPGNTIDSLLFWLNAVREHSQQAIETLKQENPSQFSKL